MHYHIDIMNAEIVGEIRRKKHCKQYPNCQIMETAEDKYTKDGTTETHVNSADGTTEIHGNPAVDIYTKDGTTDIHGNPAVRKDTGNWRACPYILGTVLKSLRHVLLISFHLWHHHHLFFLSPCSK